MTVQRLGLSIFTSGTLVQSLVGELRSRKPSGAAKLKIKKKKKKKKNKWPINTLKDVQGFPGGTVVKNPPANAGDTGSSPGPGRSHMLQSN